MKIFDAVIIGFGKGGKTLAVHLANQGKQVAMVEKSNTMYGGTCINVGCIPSKSLVHSGLKYVDTKSVSFDDLDKRYQEAIEEKNSLTTKLRQKNYDKLAVHENITIIDGIASFKDTHTVVVDTGLQTIEVKGNYIFINTGSTPVVPKIKGIEENPYVYYSHSLMSLSKLPKELVIIGGGYIGLEFASMYANFGSKVTVLQDGPEFLPREDKDIAMEIKKILESQGITITMAANIQEITKTGEVKYIHEDISCVKVADAILVATGRKPNINGLNLAAANIETTARGAIKVNEWRQTNIEHIFAMGDVIGGLQFTYISLDDYRVVANYLDGKKTYDASMREHVPYSVFMATPYSRVGLNEREAKEAGYNIKVTKLPVMAIPKAQVLQNTQGVLKAIIDTKTNQILGAMLLCEESFEMINIIKLAMDMGAEYTVLQKQIFTHPTMSEALNDLFTV